jgi:GMC oxidoreductase
VVRRPEGPIQVADRFLSTRAAEEPRRAGKSATQLQSVRSSSGRRCRAISKALGSKFIRDAASTCRHQSGTAKMRHDAMSVLDGSLDVHGDHLRIADGSIMPPIVAGNTMAAFHWRVPNRDSEDRSLSLKTATIFGVGHRTYPQSWPNWNSH